ncbi:HGxxPAAW family protein [Dermacoccus barathri]|uniref:HGxxPAAW family protein n=1 Tax=Dermacoccus barathri TaxID=322601 RepID=UPI00187A9561|nr:HGxxPAAW family protein [Dermacoccus barathri]MBE7372563.1 hypothetical protein [Dermacoccus barathri]
MSGDSPYLDHGHSVAAWTGVTICMIASLIIAAGVFFDNDMLAIVGGIVFIAGGLVGWAMGKANKGKKKGQASHA